MGQGKIIALDIGGKRTGIAETDEMQIIASPRETVATNVLLLFLHHIFPKENFIKIIIGEPKNLDGGDSENSQRVRDWKAKIEKSFPQMEVILQDERFTSKMAADSLFKSGMTKKKRREKSEIDKVSAALILQSYLQKKPL